MNNPTYYFRLQPFLPFELDSHFALVSRNSAHCNCFSYYSHGFNIRTDKVLIEEQTAFATKKRFFNLIILACSFVSA